MWPSQVIRVTESSSMHRTSGCLSSSTSRGRRQRVRVGSGPSIRPTRGNAHLPGSSRPSRCRNSRSGTRSGGIGESGSCSRSTSSMGRPTRATTTCFRPFPAGVSASCKNALLSGSPCADTSGKKSVKPWDIASAPWATMALPSQERTSLFERFTERARQVVVLAQDEARALKHNYIGTEHILLGLLREEEGLAARVLESLDITVEEVRAQVARIVGQGDEVTTGQIPFTPRAKKVLELALREALSLGHNYIGTEHILLGLVRENEGVAARILLDFDADSEKIRNEVIRMLSGPGGRRQQGAGAGQQGEGKKSSKLLDQFGRNLTKLAAE